jgi:hypothetical protein
VRLAIALEGAFTMLEPVCCPLAKGAIAITADRASALLNDFRRSMVNMSVQIRGNQ